MQVTGGFFDKRHFCPTTSLMPKILSFLRRSLLSAFFCLGLATGFAQTVFLDFNTVGQFTNNFNLWNDNGSGANAGVYSFEESTTDGVGGGGGVSVYQSTDTTATY